MRFGVYPLGVVGGPDGVVSGPPDDMNRVIAALTELRGDKAPVVPRMYVPWTGDDSAARLVAQVAGVPWDLVLCYRHETGDAAGFAEFVADVVRAHGDTLDSVQVTGEPNMGAMPFAADGAFPDVVPAMVLGVQAAAAARRDGQPVRIGIGLVPSEFEDSDFWSKVAACDAPAFASALDYAALDIYPDVFGGRVPLESVPDVVEGMVGRFRATLTEFGVPATTELRIGENGWPTGADRPEELQADVLEAVIRTCHRLEVGRWQLFALRDANSSGATPFHHFGVLRDDYSPKPAFHRLRMLIEELSD
ncbi:hypothetical protein [Labedaea rhizosphaerae]|uniref:Uncharacterized protein n=1 Tax=Labedaea rhizosphaerae TaxID=598644 RepID=A0A4R6SIF2_LABRH|nr:hypothetical protein [Labedaea rhizosphaerae]TDQ01370.1 hypothetical protein EV186_1021238 [Labedaea rhizosphaerae]